jgi:hypothetical protein
MAMVRSVAPVACILISSLGFSEITTGQADSAQGMSTGYEAQGMPVGHKGADRANGSAVRSLYIYEHRYSR